MCPNNDDVKVRPSWWCSLDDLRPARLGMVAKGYVHSPSKGHASPSEKSTHSRPKGDLWHVCAQTTRHLVPVCNLATKAVSAYDLSTNQAWRLISRKLTVHIPTSGKGPIKSSISPHVMPRAIKSRDTFIHSVQACSDAFKASISSLRQSSSSLSLPSCLSASRRSRAKDNRSAEPAFMISVTPGPFLLVKPRSQAVYWSDLMMGLLLMLSEVFGCC